MQTSPIDGKCTLCTKFEIKRRRIRKEEAHIKRWEQEPSSWKARSREIVSQLEAELQVLIQQRETP